MPSNFVLLPIQYHNVWELYKELQSAFWTVEDVLGVARVGSVGLASVEAVQLLAFTASSGALAASSHATTLCPAAEFDCFLGLQAFLESVHLEGAARIVDEGASTSPAVKTYAWATVEMCDGGDDSPESTLLYTVAFWAAWTGTLGAWRIGPGAGTHPKVDALAGLMHRDGLLFLKFAIERLCSICDGGDITNEKNKSLLQVYYTRLASDMEATLVVRLDHVKGLDQLAEEITDAIHVPRVITRRKKRAAAEGLELDADF